jgi:hypothetical protein
MESTLHKPAFVAGNAISKSTTILFWIFTALFCLEMSFTAYYELLPQGAQAFTHLGFTSSYFRLELSLAKLVGVALLLLPMVPARLKEWAVSAIIAHLSISDRALAFVPSTLTSVLWAASYFFSRRLQGSRSNQSRALEL